MPETSQSTPIDKFGAMRSGLLEFVVLHIIAVQTVYAANILEQLSQSEFKTQEGTLYPLLSKLRREGTVEYEWRESDAGPPRKYYRLTLQGKKQLKEMDTYWKHIIETIKTLGNSHE